MASKTNPSKPRAKKATGANRIWPIVLVGGGILLVALAYFALRDRGQPGADVNPQAGGSPNITVEPAVIDMGDIKLGTPVKASFTVTNAGNQPLQLTEDPYIELVEGC